MIRCKDKSLNKFDSTETPSYWHLQSIRLWSLLQTIKRAIIISLQLPFRVKIQYNSPPNQKTHFQSILTMWNHLNCRLNANMTKLVGQCVITNQFQRKAISSSQIIIKKQSKSWLLSYSNAENLLLDGWKSPITSHECDSFNGTNHKLQLYPTHVKLQPVKLRQSCHTVYQDPNFTHSATQVSLVYFILPHYLHIYISIHLYMVS